MSPSKKIAPQPPAKARTPARPQRRTQAERRQTTQDKLVQGAIQLLKAKRYAGFRTAEVAAVAGVSRGAQTHHFATKDDLVLLALEEVYRDTGERSRRRIAGARQTREGLLHALVEDSAEFFLGDDFLLSLDLVMVGGNPALGASVRKLAQRYRFAVEEDWRQALLAVGLEPAEADDVIWLTFSVGRGLGVRQVMSGPSPRFREVLEHWGRLAAERIGAAPASASLPRPRAARKR
jgi:AcrR family transcriptional regulator